MTPRRLLIAAAFILPVLLILVPVYWLLYSTSAPHWLLDRAMYALSGRLDYAAVQGRLAGPLEITGLRYEDDKLRLDIAHLVLDWRPGRLLGGTLDITRLAAREITAHRKTPDTPATAATSQPPAFSLPLAVRLAGLELQDIHYTSADATLILDRIAAGAEFRDHLLHLTRFAVAAPRFSATGRGRIATRDTYALSLDLRFTATPPTLAQFAGEVSLRGDLRTLHLRQTLTQPLRGRLEATLQDPLEAQRWEARLTVESFDPATLLPGATVTGLPEWLPASLQGEIAGKGREQDFALHAELAARWPAVPLAIRLAARHRPGRVTLDSLQVDLDETGSRFTAAGTVDYDGRESRLHLAGTWHDLHWPLTGVPAFRSQRGDYRIEGHAGDYRFRIAGDLNTPRLDIPRLTLAGRGTERRLALEHFAAQILGGRLSGRALARWTSDPSTAQWQIELTGQEVNPGKRWPDWPGRLDFTLTGEGRGLPAAGGEAAFTLQRLGGILRNRSLTGEGRLALADDTLHLGPLVLGVGSARLSLSGTAGRNLALGWYLDLPRLDDLLPDAAGNLQVRGNVSGPREDPVLALAAEGRALRLAAQRIGRLTARILWQPGETRPSHLALNALDLDLNGIRLAQLALRGGGRRGTHGADLWLDGGNYNALLRLEGAWQGQAWRGRLARLRLMLPDDDRIWQIPAPVAIEASARNLTLSPLCLQQDGDHRLCLEGAWRRGADWHAAAAGENLPLDLLQPWLPPAVTIKGTVTLDAQARGTASGDMTGTLALRSTAGRLHFTPSRGEPVPLEFRDLQILGRLAQGRLRMTAGADLADNGTLAGNLELPVPALDPADQRLAGQVDLTLRQLRPIALLLPEVEEVTGELAAELRVTGTLTTPALALHLNLANGRLRLPTLGIEPHAIQLAVDSRAGVLHYRGQARSGPGHIAVSGRFRPAGHSPGKEDWHLEADLRGRDFLIADTREYRVLASPDLRLALTPVAGTLTGTLAIPEADLRPRRLSGGVRPSPDVVVVGDENAGGSDERFQLTSRIRLELGKRVRFEGFGLKARLAGALYITDRPRQLVTASGELRVLEGRYKAYGQDLRIERGRLIFVGGPIDNPGLDIRAVRQVGDVSAGLQISGDALQPLLRIFSDPPMSETDALSYLLLGRPPQGDKRSEKEQLSAAATALGLGGASFLSKRLGETLGLEELAVESEQDGGEIRLKLGTYLSPRLYVGYGWGMMETVNTFLVRYQLSERITIEAQSSSEAVGGDVLLSIER